VKKPLKRNQLRSIPPEHYHQLRDTTIFRRVTGRSPRATDYHGVHTTDDLPVAASYAISAWNLRGAEDDDMPAVVRLDTDGLKPLADVDAAVFGLEIFQANRETVAGLLRDGLGVYDIESCFDGWGGESGEPILVGADPALVIFDEIVSRPPNIINLLIEYAGVDAVIAFALEGHVPDRVLSEVVRQRRYLHDFDLDRVVGIDAVQPWWGEIVNEDEEHVVELLGEAGWDVITFEDAASFNILPHLRTIWGEPLGGARDLHGTTMRAVRAAFPDITLKPGFPPPVSSEKIDITRRGRDIDEDE